MSSGDWQEVLSLIIGATIQTVDGIKTIAGGGAQTGQVQATTGQTYVLSAAQLQTLLQGQQGAGGGLQIDTNMLLLLALVLWASK